MDCDLQDPPEEIGNLYAKAQEGYNVFLARRVNRQDSTSRMFFRVFNYTTGIKHDPAVGNFGIYFHNVIDAVVGMGGGFFVTSPQWFNGLILTVQALMLSIANAGRAAVPTHGVSFWFSLLTI